MDTNITIHLRDKNPLDTDPDNYTSDDEIDFFLEIQVNFKDSCIDEFYIAETHIICLDSIKDLLTGESGVIYGVDSFWRLTVDKGVYTLYFNGPNYHSISDTFIKLTLPKEQIIKVLTVWRDLMEYYYTLDTSDLIKKIKDMGCNIHLDSRLIKFCKIHDIHY